MKSVRRSCADVRDEIKFRARGEIASSHERFSTFAINDRLYISRERTSDLRPRFLARDV